MPAAVILSFNRPFVFLVYDEEQQAVMFMGIVNRPQKLSNKLTASE
jgi:serine protease inhibitor